MKKRFIQRQLKSSLKVNPSKIISLKSIFKLFITLIVSVLILYVFIYLSIYLGYESKMIDEIEDIPIEATSALIFSDGISNNFKEYAKLAQSAYLNRNVSEVIIINPYNDNLSDLIKSNLNKVPENKLKVLDNYYFENICNEYLNLDLLKKYILISNPDITIRLSAICSVLDVYIVPYKVNNVAYTIDYNKRLEETLKIVFNSF